jgi:hypothetical protein
MATSPSDQNNSNIIAWLDRLNASVRSAGGQGGPKAFNLDNRTKAELIDSDNDSDRHGRTADNEEADDGTDRPDETEDLRGLPDSAVPLGLIANLSLSNSKGRVKNKVGLDVDDVDDDNVVRAVAIFLIDS